MAEESEKEKMLNNQLYLATDPELVMMQSKAQQLLNDLNNCGDLTLKQEIIVRLFGKIGSNFTIRPPFYCDYGCHIFAGDNLYINYDCVILDCNRVYLGNNVLLAPKVQIYTGLYNRVQKLRQS